MRRHLINASSRSEQIGKIVEANAEYLDQAVVDEVAALTQRLGRA
ncbi:hypothetical protein [Mycobacteroides abscessus]|nr:hypothetical protein [Mycobacteroides abscessus]